MCQVILVLISLCFVMAAVVVLLDDSLMPFQLRPYSIVAFLIIGFTFIPVCNRLSCCLAKKTTTFVNEEESVEEQPMKTVTVSLM